MCRVGVRKGKAHMALNQTNHVEGKKKVFFQVFSSKREACAKAEWSSFNRDRGYRKGRGTARVLAIGMYL